LFAKGAGGAIMVVVSVMGHHHLAPETLRELQIAAVLRIFARDHPPGAGYVSECRSHALEQRGRISQETPQAGAIVPGLYRDTGCGRNLFIHFAPPVMV